MEVFRLLLRRVDRMASPVLCFDEVRRWATGVLDQLTEAGIVREINSTFTVHCDSCADGHVLEVDVREYPTGTVGVAKCPECGRVTVPLDRLRQWEPCFVGLARAIAVSIGTGADVAIESPGRLAFLGVIQRDGRTADLFVGRGMGWPDASQVLASSQRLRASPFPAMLVPAIMPTLDQRLPVRPAFGAISELAHFAERRLVINTELLCFQDAIPHSEAKSPKWMTVTDAAKCLMEVVSGLDLQRAKSRVSIAADRDEFKTNGKKRTDRRIDRDTFSTWLLKQRERDLAEADADEW